MFRLKLLFSLVFLSASIQAENALDVLSPSYQPALVEQLPTNSQRGQLRPVNFTVLSAGIDGQLSEFRVKTGSTIRKGDVIARFYCEQEKAAHQIAVAKVAVAEKNLEINEKLDAYQNISELDLQMSKAEVDIARAESRRTKSVVDQCDILSPYNATVTDKQAQAFQYVNKGDPLLEIVDTDTLEIEMVLPSLDVVLYKKGLPFTLTIDENGVIVNAIVDRVVNVIDPVSQTIRVIGTITDRSTDLMPGMSGVVRFDRE